MQLNPERPKRYHVFLASPGDVNAEREAVRQFFKDYNTTTAQHKGLDFQVIDWENYAETGAGRPQELITQQTLERYRSSLALVIGIMDQRFGSPTGEAESGTEEEFNWAFRSHQEKGWPEIKWFFRRRDYVEWVSADPQKRDEVLRQFDQVQAFKTRVRTTDQLLYKEYENLEDFGYILSHDLTMWLNVPERPWNQANPTRGPRARRSPIITRQGKYIVERETVRERFLPIGVIEAGDYTQSRLVELSGSQARRIEGAVQTVDVIRPIEPFRDRHVPGISGRLTKAPLDSPERQSLFLEFNKYQNFFREYDPSQSYWFEAGEKTGKTSWLAHIAQWLLSSQDGLFEPIWINNFPDTDNPRTILIEWFSQWRAGNHDKQPVFFIDNAHLYPNFIRQIPDLRSSDSPLLNVPICVTYHRDEPDRDDWKDLWGKSQKFKRAAKRCFVCKEGFPDHIIVSDDQGELTQDGECLLSLVRESLGVGVEEMVFPLFKQPRQAVSLYWLSSLVTNNHGKTIDKVNEWLDCHRSAIGIESLYRSAWGGTQLRQDILRAVAFLEFPTIRLVQHFCARLRGYQTSEVEARFKPILQREDIWEEQKHFKDYEETLRYLKMPDGLESMALARENFGPADVPIFETNLLVCIAEDPECRTDAARSALYRSQRHGAFKCRLAECIKAEDWEQCADLPIHLSSLTAELYRDLKETKNEVWWLEHLLRNAEERQLFVQIAKALVNKGIALGELKRPEEEIAAYDEVVKRFGEAEETDLLAQVARALRCRGIALGEQGKPEEELSAYDEVMRRFGEAEEPALREHVAKALIDKGLALGEQKKLEEEVAVYDKVVRRFGESDDLALREQVAQALFNKGVTLGMQDKPQEAIEVYNEILQHFGEDQEPADRKSVV